MLAFAARSRSVICQCVSTLHINRLNNSQLPPTDFIFFNRAHKKTNRHALMCINQIISLKPLTVKTSDLISYFIENFRTSVEIRERVGKCKKKSICYIQDEGRMFATYPSNRSDIPHVVTQDSPVENIIEDGNLGKQEFR